MYDKIKSKGISVAKRLRRVAIAQVVLGCTSLAISFSLVSNVLSVASASLALSLLGADPASAFANSRFDTAIRGLDISIIVFACIELAGCAAVWGTLIAPAIIREALYAIGTGSLAGYSGSIVLSSQIFVIEWTAIALVGTFVASLVNIVTAVLSLVMYDQYEMALEDAAATNPDEYVVVNAPPQSRQLSPRRQAELDAAALAAVLEDTHEEDDDSPDTHDSPPRGLSPLSHLSVPSPPHAMSGIPLGMPGRGSDIRHTYGMYAAPQPHSDIRQKYGIYAAPQPQWQYGVHTPQRQLRLQQPGW